MASDVLYHFSEDPAIEAFVPRPSTHWRPAGFEWMKEPLVWAIDDWHSPCYLFPRDCPRVLWWPLPTSKPVDLDRHWGTRDSRMIACVEWAWAERLATTPLYRYTLASGSFEDTRDHGVHVSRESVRPLRVERLDGLPGRLREAGVELRLMPSLVPLRGMWDSTLHVSGIRLRNAVGWQDSDSEQQRFAANQRPA